MSATPHTLETRRVDASLPIQVQIANLEHWISNPPQNTRIVEFSPELAEYVLTNWRHKNNRTLKKAALALYSEDMKAQRWALTGDTVKFGHSKLLVDGHHRLTSCVRAGIPFRTHVAFGVDDQLFARMDIGKNRSGADVFTIMGVPNAVQVAAAVRWLMILKSGNPGDRGAQFDNEELKAFYTQKVDQRRLEEAVKLARTLYERAKHPIGSCAALCYIMMENDAVAARNFFRDWANLQSTNRNRMSVVKRLQGKLADLAHSNNGRVHENVRNAVIIRAWRAYQASRQLGRGELNWERDDEFPSFS